MSETRISIVMPVRDEPDNIVDCLARLAHALDGTEYEVLVCYDMEDDSTLPAISSLRTIIATSSSRSKARGSTLHRCKSPGSILFIRCAPQSTKPTRCGRCSKRCARS